MSKSDRVLLPKPKPRGGTQKDLEDFALALCASYSRLPDAHAPFDASTLVWQGRPYIYVTGWDGGRNRRLLEVFQRHPQHFLEPILAFQYPPPFRDLFNQDYDILYSPDPWGDSEHSQRIQG
ncbi:hypothetical protein [Cupriavidus neocaledonicus]|uniref:Uncharacterized protein n=1 Tax=Cupriavidus neocaledonicus TaxID=1040979 RepID=A0A375H439_9BURK|nr:hypothetical protein [Cupriavidus neocaledonicus]SPD46691.1 conserved protein of unknown function [Cupriavidus neocaledonicus]